MNRVLIIDLSQSFGGADVRVAQIAAGLRQEHEIKVAVIGGSQTEARLEASGLDLVRLRRSRRDPRLFRDLVGTLRAWNPTVVDAHNPQSMLWGLTAARHAGVPVRIATFHSVFAESERRFLGRYLFAGLERLVATSATHMVSVSDTVTRHLMDAGIAPAVVTTIPNGVPIPRVRERARAEGQRIRIVTVGRLVPVKAQRVLIAALARVVPGCPEVECVIVGDGPERSALERLASELGLSAKVTFLGFRNDIAAILADADLFCLPSLTEALPFAALEAAAQGLPIVCSRVGGLEACFGPDHVARLVPPGDVEALAEALRAVVADVDAARAMGRRAREMVTERFSMSRTLAATADVYRNTGLQPVGATVGEWTRTPRSGVV